ncbi:MAG: MATE family efflux transporter [Candidatus Marinimicrobia bacterium]|nr:MATE family efflux transporter [Candidatus Neomarinimicrobiota bacterium]
MKNEKKQSRLKEFIYNPRKALWKLAVPMMFGMMIQTVYMIADMIFVGQVSADSLTALAFNMPLLFFGLGITFGLGSGVTAVVAQFIGAEDKKNADNSAEHGIVLGIILGVAFTFAGLRWGETVLSAIGVPAKLLPFAWSYFRVIVLGYIFMVLSVFFRSILSGEGDVKTPVIIQGSGTVLNIILDPIFIFGFGLGVQGAALATVVSQACVALVFVYLLFVKKHAYVTFAMRDFKFSGDILRKIFTIGMPASFSMVIMSLGGGTFNRILVSFTSDAVAAFQVGGRVEHAVFVPFISIATALVTLTGMFYGAKRLDLVRQIIRYGMSRAAIIGAVFALFFFLLAPVIMDVFTDSDSIVQLGAHYLRIIVFSYPFIPITMISGRVLQGLGYGMPLFVITFLRVILLSFSLAVFFVFVLNKGVEWVWIAQLISVLISAFIALLWLRWGLRRAEKGEVVAVEKPDEMLGSQLQEA